MDDTEPNGFQGTPPESSLSVDQLLNSLVKSERELKKQLMLFSAFLDALPNPIFVKDNKAVFLACNTAYEEAFGIRREDFVGKTVLDLDYLPEAARQAFQQADLKLLQERGETREEIELAFSDGKPRTVLYQRKTFDMGDGQGGLLGLIIDISERKRAEEFERFRSRILEMLASSTVLEDILLELVTGIESLYPDMLCSIMQTDIAGSYLCNGIAPSLPDFYNAALEKVEIVNGMGSCGTAAFTGERVIVEDISTHPYWATVRELAAQADLKACWSQPIKTGRGAVLGTFAIYHRTIAAPTEEQIAIIQHCARLSSIAIEKKRAENTIRELAYSDPLTNLANRRLLDEKLAAVLSSGQSASGYTALMLLDLDNFKPLNDQYGHAMGDRLLIEIGKRLNRCIRSRDTVARLGGDEFVIVLETLSPDFNTAVKQVRQVAEKIRATIEKPCELKLVQDGGSLQSVVYQCTASIGVTLFAGNDLSQTEVIRKADEAMYQAKQSGRNTVNIY
jgi:diguanylate cyclase (GGDEF)-like protein/PAS domain S-box-containing protein